MMSTKFLVDMGTESATWRGSKEAPKVNDGRMWGVIVDPGFTLPSKNMTGPPWM
jgi:hypothetical protein